MPSSFGTEPLFSSGEIIVVMGASDASVLYSEPFGNQQTEEAGLHGNTQIHTFTPIGIR